jgi:ribosomal protein S18 acetylase RimI-like enzyme
MDFSIRSLTIDDYDEIIRVWLTAGLTFKPKGRDSRELIEIEMNRSHCIYYGLETNGKLVGVAIADWDGRRGWVNRVAIDPDYRGQRLASRLIEKCEEFLVEQGALVICALIEDVNTPSMSTFERSGYNCEDNFKYWVKRSSMDA